MQTSRRLYSLLKSSFFPKKVLGFKYLKYQERSTKRSNYSIQAFPNSSCAIHMVGFVF